MVISKELDSSFIFECSVLAMGILITFSFSSLLSYGQYNKKWALRTRIHQRLQLMKIQIHKSLNSKCQKGFLILESDCARKFSLAKGDRNCNVYGLRGRTWWNLLHCTGFRDMKGRWWRGHYILFHFYGELLKKGNVQHGQGLHNETLRGHCVKP